MEWQAYFYIENLGLNNQRKQSSLIALPILGLHHDAPHPRDRDHWRVLHDNEAAIIKATFNVERLTLSSIIARQLQRNSSLTLFVPGMLKEKYDHYF